MIALGYTRVSSRGQAERGLSMEAQSQAIKAYCQLYGLDLVEIIEDRGISAKTVKRRPGMLTLIDRVREKEADAVVVYKLDRMFRTMRDALAVLDEFKARGVAFHSVVEKWDTSTAIGDFAMNMVLAVAQLERKQIGERTSMALRAMKKVTREDTALHRHRKKNGLLWVGLAPYGYRLRRKNYVIHPEEMALVYRIRAMARDGMKRKMIAKALTQDGVTTRRGTPFDPNQIRRIVDAEYYEEIPKLEGAEEVGVPPRNGGVAG